MGFDSCGWGYESVAVSCEESNEELDSIKAIPVTSRSNAYVCGHSLPGVAGSNPAGCMGVYCECCVFAGRGIFDGPIPRPEESYRVYVCVCFSLSVIKCNNNPRVFVMPTKHITRV